MMDLKITRIVVLLLMLLSPAMAQHTEPWCANRELRKKEASRLLKLLSAMDEQVPVLSPAEQQWLDAEINSGNGRFTDRVIRAMDSQEYDISTAKLHFALFLPDLLKTSPLQPGTCRICKCTEYRRCRYLPRPGVPLGSQQVMTCEWADKTKTLCTNPVCLEKAKAGAD